MAASYPILGEADLHAARQFLRRKKDPGPDSRYSLNLRLFFVAGLDLRRQLIGRYPDANIDVCACCFVSMFNSVRHGFLMPARAQLVFAGHANNSNGT